MSRLPALIGVAALATALALAPAQAAPEPPALPAVAPGEIEAEQAWLLEAIRKIKDEHDLPAIGAVILRPDGRDIGAVSGKRRADQPEQALIDDAWHLGSNGKSMTALVVARLAERRMLSLDDTMGKLFPDLAKGWGEAARSITVDQLATQTSGLRDTVLSQGALLRWMAMPGEMQAKRRAIVDEIMKAGPEKPASDGFAYANLNYVILGGIVEKVTGRPFEDVFREELLVPMKIESAGFEAPKGERGTIWGHNLDEKDLVPVNPNHLGSDNPREIVAAGTAHMNLRDWGRYAREVIAGAQGKGRMLKPATYRRILTPKPLSPGYAYGWGVRDVPNIGRVMTHSGSNTLWFAYVRLFPERNAGYLVTTNVAGERAEAAMRSAVEAIEGHIAEKYSKQEK